MLLRGAAPALLALRQLKTMTEQSGSFPHTTSRSPSPENAIAVTPSVTTLAWCCLSAAPPGSACSSSFDSSPGDSFAKSCRVFAEYIDTFGLSPYIGTGSRPAGLSHTRRMAQRGRAESNCNRMFDDTVPFLQLQAVHDAC